jgi:hypothetical protein
VAIVSTFWVSPTTSKNNGYVLITSNVGITCGLQNAFLKQ